MPAGSGGPSVADERAPERIPQLLWGSVALSVAIALAGLLIAGALGRVRQGADLMEVTGSARRPARADLIVWRVSIGAQQADLRSAYADVRRQSARVLGYLRGRGIPDSSIAAGAISVDAIQEMRDGMNTGRTLGYRGSQQIQVRSRDVDGVARLSVDVMELTNDGVELNSFSPEYVLTGLDTLRVQMLAEATADARERADAIARAAGSRVGALRNVRTGVIQVVPRFSTEVSDYGMNDVSARDKDVMAVVRVTFAIR